jgi:hypothetical protein
LDVLHNLDHLRERNRLVKSIPQFKSQLRRVWGRVLCGGSQNKRKITPQRERLFLPHMASTPHMASLFRCSCSAVHRSQQTTMLQRVQHAPGLSQGVCLATFNICITFKTLAKIKLLKIKIFSLVSTQITLGMSGSRRSPSKHLQKDAQRTPVRFHL